MGVTNKYILKIDQFVYTTPFTKEGKSQGSINEQFLRKTIVTVIPAFPYLVKRLLITDKKEVFLLFYYLFYFLIF